MKKILLVVGALLLASIAQAQNVDLQLTTTLDASRKSVIPRLTWSTTPAATSCTATGSTGWPGTKAASGTQTLAATNATISYALQCSWPGVTKATVVWTAPTTNTDGTAYTNPGGFRILWGTSATNLDQTVYLQDPALRTWTSGDLSPGVWYFGVIAFNSLGIESALSNVANKTLTAGATNSASVGLEIKTPNPPAVQ